MRSRSAAAINSARMLRLGRTRTEIRRTRWCCKEAPRRARVLADWEDLARAAPAAKLGLARRAMQRRLRAPAEVRRARDLPEVGPVAEDLAADLADAAAGRAAVDLEAGAADGVVAEEDCLQAAVEHEAGRAARGDCSGSGRIVIDTVFMTRTTVRR